MEGRKAEIRKSATQACRRGLPFLYAFEDRFGQGHRSEVRLGRPDMFDWSGEEVARSRKYMFCSSCPCLIFTPGR